MSLQMRTDADIERNGSMDTLMQYMKTLETHLIILASFSMFTEKLRTLEFLTYGIRFKNLKMRIINMTSVQQYLKLVHDRSTPVWVMNLVGTVINIDICDALSGIEAVRELLEAKFQEQIHG